VNEAVYAYVERALSKYPNTVTGKVLEVGSLNINGTVRLLFSDRERFPQYVGVDIRTGPGPGVDVQAKASELPFPDESFDCVVSTETLEHDSRFWISVQEFARVLRPYGNLLLTTCGNGYPWHQHPNDYWRFLPEGLYALLGWAGLSIVEAGGPEVHNVGALGVYALAVKVGGRDGAI
jgi:SAM-dependent methyltransferase